MPKGRAGPDFDRDGTWVEGIEGGLERAGEVVLKANEQELMLTIQNGDFQDVHLKVATVVRAEAHPKVWLKVLQTLAITGRENLDPPEPG
ncbi:hypothetical protein BGX29_008278 [Mortierella sp. GBA35]|nr:hypothetical protein BGX29_008278 [Mortierella sp. GBA35]